jgi:HTH-type transcriptional regulator / antitoxin HipB
MPFEAYVANMPLEAYNADMSGHTLQTAAQLATHLRSLRKSRELTQAQLGALVGLDQTRIAKIERNPGLVSVEQLLKILTALGVQMVLQPRAPSSERRSTKQPEW